MAIEYEWQMLVEGKWTNIEPTPNTIGGALNHYGTIEIRILRWIGDTAYYYAGILNMAELRHVATAGYSPAEHVQRQMDLLKFKLERQVVEALTS